MISFLIPEKDLPYDPKDRKSVAEYTKLLENKTLRDYAYVPGGLDNVKNKGLYGQKIENLFFFIKTNNHAGADFPDIPLELKTAGLLSTSSRDRHKNISGKWKSKEALPMSAISFEDIVNEDFFSSRFLEKNKNILLIFYKFEANKVVYDLEIKVTGVWSFSEIPDYDKKIIMDDWEKIKSLVINGEAHNISRKDTDYLEAMPSATSDSMTSQPFGPKARTRKFSFKAGYMHSVIAKLGSEKTNTISLFKKSDENINLSDKINDKFAPYIGMDASLIASSIDVSIEDCKQAFSILSKRLVKAIFNVPEKRNIEEYVEEFSKAEVTIKTIRINKDSLPKEHVSFPAFKYEEIVNQSWDTSDFKRHIDKKFLFIFFKESGSSFFLDRAVYWNMSSNHMNEAKKVWDKTRELIQLGTIVKNVKHKRRYTYFPGSKDNLVAHVRPHAKDAKDTYKLPVNDISTKSSEYTKHCFWFNREYVKDYIYNLKK